MLKELGEETIRLKTELDLLRVFAAQLSSDYQATTPRPGWTRFSRSRERQCVNGRIRPRSPREDSTRPTTACARRTAHQIREGAITGAGDQPSAFLVWPHEARNVPFVGRPDDHAARS
jgi:hypothetical protein